MSGRHDPQKVELAESVLEMARKRISWVFDTFPRIYVSGPSGKDSGVLAHLACQEARRRGRKIGLLYLDLEAQYKLTIDFVREIFAMYADVLDPYWVALPLHLRNAVSMAQPYWISWDPEAQDAWVRPREPGSISDPAAFPFYVPPGRERTGERTAMEFEEFVAQFGGWYGQGQPCCCLVGIRTDESLNRWRTIVKDRRSRLDDLAWTAWKGGQTWNAYPIYDWRTEDVWTYYGKEKMAYPRIYDLMYRAGVPFGLMRICQPYGDDQRKGLGLFHVLEPETWNRVVARVLGANAGALYAGKHGNILGNGKITLPPGHTWRSYTLFLLETLPEAERQHYEDKFAVFRRWWMTNYGFTEMPDAPDEELAKQFPAKGGPSWQRLAKAILKNDRMCRSLSFSQHKSGAYANYQAIMRKRRAAWGI